MRAAILQGNTVANVIVLNSLSEYPGAIDGTNADIGDTWDGAQFVKPTQPEVEPPVPAEVTMRQGRLALLQAGKLTQVDAAIDAMPEPDKSAARIEWEYSNTLQRSNPFVAQLGAALGMTSAEVDQLFRTASTL